MRTVVFISTVPALQNLEPKGSVRWQKMPVLKNIVIFFSKKARRPFGWRVPF